MTDKSAPFEKVKALPASVAILDASGRIVAVNDTWKDFGRRNGLRVDRFAVGANYLEFCRSHDLGMRRFATNLRALLARRLDLLTFVYPCHSPTRQRWFSLIGVPLSQEASSGAALLHVNLTGMMPGRAGAKRKGARRPSIDLAAIGVAVEQSVQTQLSRQLATMAAGAIPDVKRRQRATPAETERTGATGARLSKRQAEILRLIGEGKTNKEIAKTLARSPNTVKLHVSAILKRLKVKSRTQAAVLSAGLFSPMGTADADVQRQRGQGRTSHVRIPERSP
jgi:DNA-binding CsgD family transcriptional regulator